MHPLNRADPRHHMPTISRPHSMGIPSRSGDTSANWVPIGGSASWADMNSTLISPPNSNDLQPSIQPYGQVPYLAHPAIPFRSLAFHHQSYYARNNLQWNAHVGYQGDTTGGIVPSAPYDPFVSPSASLNATSNSSHQIQNNPYAPDSGLSGGSAYYQAQSTYIQPVSFEE